MGSRYIVGAGGGGGGGGSASYGALLRQTGEDDKGIFVTHRDADLSWHLQGEQRSVDEPAAAAALEFLNFDEDAHLDVALPLDWIAPPEVQNIRDILYVKYPNPFAGVKADSLYGALQVRWATVGAAGNSQRYRVTAGTAAVASQNAKADIEGSRGATPDHQGVIRVTSPDGTGTVDAVAGSNPAYGNNSAFMNVRALVPGTDMNGFTLAMSSVRDNGQTEEITWAATYSSDNRTLNIVATLNTFDLFGVSTVGLVAAINAARTAQGEQLVEANGTTTGLQQAPITINYIRSNDNPLRNITGLVLSGGTHASGGGTATNRGEIRVVSSGARAAGTAAKYDWQIAAGRRITVTFNQVGVAGNNLQFTIMEDTTNLNGNTVNVSDSGSDFLVRYNGSITLGTIVNAMNAATSRFTCTITQGSRADSVTPSGNVSYRTAGGVDPVNPLSAAWDADEHRLTVTALASDTFDEVRTAIIALSEFQIGDGTSAGDVALEDGALTSDTIDVPATVGNHVDYDFAGGTDAVARTPLTVAERFIANIGGVNSYILDILGAINTDTVQNIIDAYSGARFELAAASGRQATDTVTGNAKRSTLLTGGQDAVPRLLPEVTLADDGRVGISLHSRGNATNRAHNTTLAELQAAFRAATYTDTDGATQTFTAANASIDTTGGGAAGDIISNSRLPVRPTGGRNETMAGPTEAEARPDDEVDGPNIQVRYDAAETLQDIYDSFVANNSGGFTFTLVYGTDPTAIAETAPFSRTLLVTGGDDAPTDPLSGLTQSQVDGRIRALAKGYALRGGGGVPDDDIPSGVTRDSEVTTILRAVAQHALAAGEDDNIFFERVSDSTIYKASTQLLRALVKGYVGAWSDKSSSFVFRKGDLTDHDGRLYWITADTAQKDNNDGPETNSDFQLLDHWGGAWASGWYKAGTYATHSSNVYLATAGVVNSDPAPDAAGNTKWARLNNEFIDGGNWSATAGTYAKNTFVYHTTQKATYLTHNTATPATIEPGVASNWADHYRRIGYEDGAPDSVTTLDFGNGRLRLTTRGGTHHDAQIPTGGTPVVANPAGTDGDPLTRITIGGINYVVDADVPVGMALLAGRVTSTAGKFPSNLEDHTAPIRVPIPTYGDLTDAESPGGDAAAWKAASRDWPVIPIIAIGADGGFLSSLDTTENSVVIAEGMYIVGTRAQNIWVNNIDAGDDLSGSVSSTDYGNPRAPTTARIIAEILVEYLDSDGSTWIELSKTFGPYTRRAPYANQVTADGGTTSTEHPGSDDANDGTGDSDYDGTLSPVTASMFTVITVPPGGLTIRFRLERGDSMAAVQVSGTPIEYDDEGYPQHPPAGANRHLGGLDGGTAPWGFFADIPGISLFPLGRPVQTEPLTPRPHITSFVSESGDLTPVAGSIANEVYGFTYTIAQGSHVGAARVIGFKGDTKPSGSATVLATLTDTDHGSGTATIPAGITLAAGEEYRLRLQVFGEGVTPGPDTVPESYHDIRIVAHAAATAAYHVGLVAYDANDADAAATAARITDFTGDTATSGALPTSMAIAVPSAADDADEFQLYLLAKSDETQPTAFTSGGLPATNSFYPAQTITIATIEFKAYILRPGQRVTKADNGDTFGVA